MKYRAFQVALGVLFLCVGGCVNEALKKINYDGADAACIDTPDYSIFDNLTQSSDVAQVYFVRVDGRDTGMDYKRPTALCLPPGEHSIELALATGQGYAQLELRMNLVAQRKYRVKASIVKREATAQVYLVEDNKEVLVGTVGTGADAIQRQPVILLPSPKSK